jgi:SHS2 domain-containing protein
MNFKFLEHTADVKFQASGKNMGEAFKNSALALKKIISNDIKINSKITKEIKIKGKDKKELLYTFLEEFLFLLDTENFILSKITKLKIIGNELIAEVMGDDSENYKFTNNVKAITYSDMFIKKQKDKYTCQVVVDV